MSIDAPETAIEKKEEIPSIRLHECSDGKHRNDEQYEIYKKQEKLKVLRAEQFKKDQSMFVHVDDIVVAAIKGEKGIGIMIGACARQEMELSLTRLTYRVYDLFQKMDMQAMLAQRQRESGIIPVDENKPEGIII